MAETTADLAPQRLGARSGVETARAKVNLALHVLGRRIDGYHDIDSLVVFAEIGDTLMASLLEEGRVELTVDGPFAPALAGTPAESNLVLRAAEALRAADAAVATTGVRFSLTKRLPVAAGIGGGSADAAAALRLLSRLHELTISRDELSEIGLKLGADVPVCLLSRPARVEGIGEKVTPVGGMPSMPMVLVNPGAAISTRDVFKQLVPAERAPLPILPESFGSLANVVSLLRTTRNDLLPPARTLAPVIGTAMNALAADPDCMIAGMSGSGATVYGIFPSTELAEGAADRMRRAEPGWWIVATRAGGLEPF